jgi:hypothetical protein
MNAETARRAGRGAEHAAGTCAGHPIGRPRDPAIDRAILDDGTVHERLTAFVQELYGTAGSGRSAQVFAAVIGEIQRNPELAEAVRAVFVSGRRKRMSALLREGVARGEIRPEVDLDLVMDLLLGPLLLRRLVTDRPVDRALGSRVVETVLEGIR